MRIAVVHDYFTQTGGAERVAEAIFQMLPTADVFATVAFPECLPPALKETPIHTSWMQSLPAIRKYYRFYFPFYPFGVSDLDLSGYDLVVSSSSGYVKGASAPPDALHVCYCHTPMRWAWNFDEYAERDSMSPPIRAILRTVVGYLRDWDKRASRQPDHFIANSKLTAERIQKAYGRAAEIIYPPIDVNRFHLSGQAHQDYYLVLSRLISYKRIDIAVEACTRLGRKLMVVGCGPQQSALEAMAGPSVRFLGRVSDQEVRSLAANCRALLCTGLEDFGMAPLEVAAAGRPAIAYHGGGALETIVEGVTGVFFDQQSPEHLMDAIERFEARAWSATHIRQHAQKFSVAIFEQRFMDFLSRVGATVRAADLIPFTRGQSFAHDWTERRRRTA
jgi:glycosyltransferase involved in cell wall biosynthesis